MSTPAIQISQATAKPTTAQVLILGGGAVVRECFIPALDRLGLLNSATIVEPKLSPAGFQPSIRVATRDYQDFFSSEDARRFTHCVVALPNALHRDAVARALRLGLHVLCEKPLALRRSECDELAALAKSCRRVLAVNMVRRLFHSVRTAVRVIERGWLGELHAVRISHGGSYLWPAETLAPFQAANGGVLADMGVHYLDLAEMLAGTLEPVAYRDDYAGGVESECEFLLRSESDTPVEVRLSRLRRLDNEISIVGSKGQLRIKVDDFDRCVFQPLQEEDAASEQITLQASDGVSHRFSDYFVEQLQRFLRSDFETESGLVDASGAARTVSLIEWAYAKRRPSPAPPSRLTAELGKGRVFVTGATGFIGSHLVDRLTRGHDAQITAGYHSLRSCAAISRYPVSYDATDLLRIEGVRKAVRGHRYVFHLAYGRDEANARPVTVQGTKNVVEASITEGVEAVVILSTMYVLGHPGGVVDETHAYHPVGGAYGRTKAEMERWCLDRARTSGPTRIIVLLPTCVYGPRGRTYTEMPVSMSRDGHFCWIEDGAGIANVVYVENLVDAMIQAAVTQDAHGHRFIINDECLSWRDFLSPTLGPWLNAVPSPTAQEFAALTTPLPGPGFREVLSCVLRSVEVRNTLSRTRLVNQVRPLLRRHAPSLASRLGNQGSRATTRPPSSRVTPPSWFADLYGPTTTRFCSEKAHRVLGWRPLMSREVALDRTVEWLRLEGLYSPRFEL